MIDWPTGKTNWIDGVYAPLVHLEGGQQVHQTLGEGCIGYGTSSMEHGRMMGLRCWYHHFPVDFHGQKMQVILIV